MPKESFSTVVLMLRQCAASGIWLFHGAYALVMESAGTCTGDAHAGHHRLKLNGSVHIIHKQGFDSFQLNMIR